MIKHQNPLEPLPTEFLQLIGHPLRWSLLGELAGSDRTVHELSGLLGEPQNLVSYHLGKLRDAKLVSMQQSAADRRDTYYTVDLTRIGGLLSDTAAKLHPGLRMAAPAVRHFTSEPVRILFLCTGNSARSQMAEALVRVRSDGVVKAYSAGSTPKPLHPNALRVMQDKYGIDLSTHVSKNLSVFANEEFDFVISLCDRVREICPEFKGQPTTVHWSIRNPATDDTSDRRSYPAFQQTGIELEIRIGFLLAALTDRPQSDARRKP